MVADGKNKPPDRPPNEVPRKVVWSDAKDHIVIRYGNDEYGYDTFSAISLFRELEDAIRDSI